MPIPTYFKQIETVAQRYAKTSLVIDSKINFSKRIGDQGHLKGSIEFIDHSILYFKEYVDYYRGNLDKRMYGYHYQDSKQQLIFRYDNSLHKPALPYREHKPGLSKRQPLLWLKSWLRFSRIMDGFRVECEVKKTDRFLKATHGWGCHSC